MKIEGRTKAKKERHREIYLTYRRNTTQKYMELTKTHLKGEQVKKRI